MSHLVTLANALERAAINVRLADDTYRSAVHAMAMARDAMTAASEEQAAARDALTDYVEGATRASARAACAHDTEPAADHWG